MRARVLTERRSYPTMSKGGAAKGRLSYGRTRKAALCPSCGGMADWIEQQPDKWWVVDGDPVLTLFVNFPCPSDELAPAIRRIGKNLFLQAKISPHTDGEIVKMLGWTSCRNTKNRHQEKTLLLSWNDSDVNWLLIEDKAAEDEAAQHKAAAC